MAWYWILAVVLGGIAAYLVLGACTERLRHYVWGVRPAYVSFWTMLAWPLSVWLILPAVVLVLFNAYEREVRIDILDYVGFDYNYHYTSCRTRGPLSKAARLDSGRQQPAT